MYVYWETIEGIEAGVAAHSCDPNTVEVEAGGW